MAGILQRIDAFSTGFKYPLDPNAECMAALRDWSRQREPSDADLARLSNEAEPTLDDETIY